MTSPAARPMRSLATVALALAATAAGGVAPAGASAPRVTGVALREAPGQTLLLLRAGEYVRVVAVLERRGRRGFRVVRRTRPATVGPGPVRLRLRPLPGGTYRVRLWARGARGDVRRVRVRASLPVRLVVSASGDLLVHTSVYRRALALGGGRRYAFGPMLAPLRPVVGAADLAMCHAETPIGGGPPRGYPLFRAPAGLADAIRATGFDVCTTASNHTLDDGLAGIAATNTALRRAGVRPVGGYTSRRDRLRPRVVDVAGVRVGIVAATEHTNGIPPPAPWAVPLADVEGIRADVARARRAGAQAVIVNVHWGDEYRHAPSAFQRTLARRIAALPGVTAIVGQHAHVVQPIGWIGRVPVVYGEGNLLSGQFGVRRDGITALLGLVVDGDRARVARVGYVVTWNRPRDHAVLPARRAVAAGDPDAGTLRAVIHRTRRVVGTGPRLHEVAGVGRFRALLRRP